ncbi:MAG: SxtJ family membrane protein [Alphaproteobacteria bacterium]
MTKKRSAHAFHEDFARHESERLSSHRSFGLTISVALVVVGLWPLVHGGPVRIWALVLAAILAMAAWLRPESLAPFNRLWSRLGLFLGGVVTPVVMGLLFFTVMTPLAFILRALGKDTLGLRFDRAAATYWVERRPPGPDPQSMRHQF